MRDLEALFHRGEGSFCQAPMPRSSYICTRNRGHADPLHVAHGAGGYVLGWWERGSPYAYDPEIEGFFDLLERRRS